MARQYDDFELVIRASGEYYSVQLLNSPAGQANGDFKLPFTSIELRNFYTRIGQVHRSTRRVETPDSEAAKKFGDKLFRSVFSGEMLGQLRTSMDRSHAQGRGLRIRLRLKGVPELAELPWEFLYDVEQDHFLATSTITPLVRFLDLPQSVTPLKVRPPLRVLVVIAGPRNLARLDAEGEWNRLCSTLSPLESRGMVVLERLPEATLDALRRRARGEPFHILHFIGHGDFDKAAGDGVLEFEDGKGMSDPVSGSFLGGILRDHDTLRLAVLNACEGARQSNRDPFSGVAQSLCQQRLPAVVAMQFEISDEAAKTFAEEFYCAISDGLPVDASLSEARKALFSGRYGQEWATPVLYMRSPSGLLFDVQRRPKSIPARPDDQPNSAVQQARAPQPSPLAIPDLDQLRAEAAERRRIEAETRQQTEGERIRREEVQRADAERERLRVEVERLRLQEERFKAEADAQEREEERERIEAEREELRAEADRLRREEERLKAEADAWQREYEQRMPQRSDPQPVIVRPDPQSPRPEPIPAESKRSKHKLLWGLVAAAIVLVIWGISRSTGPNSKPQESAERHLQRANEDFSSKLYDSAIAEYRAALVINPENEPAHAGLCNAIAYQGQSAALQKGDYDQAIAECQKAVQLQPSDAVAHSNLCNAMYMKQSTALEEKGNFNPAIAECNQAISLNPNLPEAYNNLCNAVGTRSEGPLGTGSDRGAAIAACKHAIQLRPSYAEAHKNLADLYRDQGNLFWSIPGNDLARQHFEDAAAEYRKAVESDPTYADAFTGLGDMLYKTADYAGAITELNKAIKIDPASYNAYRWLGYSKYQLKNYDEAIAAFQRAGEIRPDFVDAAYGLWLSEREKGNMADAKEALKRAYTLNSNDKTVAADYKKYIVDGQ
jgi:tetratricopeptide (TPR) repeat protein